VVLRVVHSALNQPTSGETLTGGGGTLKTKAKLTTSMTVTQFENGYWYANELKRFAEEIGIPLAKKLRKDQLEKAIILFLTTGTIESTGGRSVSKTGIKDVDKGLSLKLRVVNYTNDKATKDFLEKEARKLAPEIKRKSGARYRLNRWREEQLIRGIKITYRDLVNQYLELNQTKERFAQIPHGRYINFISDFFAAEKNATREQAIKAWQEIKRMDVPKNYRSWVQLRSKPN
jgi:SAP domain-containing new25